MLCDVHYPSQSSNFWSYPKKKKKETQQKTTHTPQKHPHAPTQTIAFNQCWCHCKCVPGKAKSIHRCPFPQFHNNNWSQQVINTCFCNCNRWLAISTYHCISSKAAADTVTGRYSQQPVSQKSCSESLFCSIVSVLSLCVTRELLFSASCHWRWSPKQDLTSWPQTTERSSKDITYVYNNSR